MNITAYHSGSAGNLYQVDDLLLEAGVPIKEIKRGLGFRLSEIRACLCSHAHADHAKAAKDLLRAGVEVYMSRGTAETLGLSGHRLHILEAGRQVEIGPWRVMPFATIHDAAEPLGFILARAGFKVLFLTDSHYSPWKFRGLTHIMIETSFCPRILKANLEAGTVDASYAKRLITSHMSIDTALGLLKANDVSAVQEIHLIHLSDANSDADEFKRRVQQVTGKPVYVAPA